MKGFFFALFMVSAALFLQTMFSFFLPDPLSKPDIAFLIVLWAAIRLGTNSGILFAFTAGLLTDSLSGAPTGLFAFIYCLAFLVCSYLNSTSDLEAYGTRFFVTFLACVSQAAIILISRYMAGPFTFGTQVLMSLFMKAFFTAMLSVVVIPVLDRFWMERPRLSGFAR